MFTRDILTKLQDEKAEGAATSEAAGSAPEAQATGEVQALKDITNESNTDKDKAPKGEKAQPRPPRERRERGPPADGIPSKTKVMVANLPYDLTEEKVCFLCSRPKMNLDTDCSNSLRNSLRHTSPRLPRSPFGLFLAS